MSRKVASALLAALILSLVATVAMAQDSSDRNYATIRGTVRLDPDGDGSCTAGTPVAGVPINFVSYDSAQDLFLQSGENGTYGLAAAGYGTWTVAAVPGEDYAVTSEKSLQANVFPETPIVLGIDFCVRETAGGSTLLPQSGAAATTPWALTLAGIMGLALMLTGGGMEWRRRWLDR